MWLSRKAIQELVDYLAVLERRIDLLERYTQCLSKSFDKDLIFTRTSMLFFLQKLMEKTLGLTNNDFIRLVKYCDGAFFIEDYFTGFMVIGNATR